jgi:hypothetical protein
MLLFIDWLCLVKAKFILDIMSKRVTVLWSLVFVTLDLCSTLAILIIVTLIYLGGLNRWIYAEAWNDILTYFNVLISIMAVTIVAYFEGAPVVNLVEVALPSTMLTSAWVMLLFVSILILKLLSPLEYIRRSFGGSRTLMGTQLEPSQRSRLP